MDKKTHNNISENNLLLRYYRLVNLRRIYCDQLQVDLLHLLYNYSVIKKRFFIFPVKKYKDKQGVYIYGKVGRGKSMIMNLYYKYCSISRKKRMHFNDFMREVHTLLKIQKDNYVINPFKEVVKTMTKKIDLLCLDEIQVYDIGDAMILSRLFHELFFKKIIVIMTSNYAPCELYQDGLQRELFLPAISLITNCMHVKCLDGNHDYRVNSILKKKLKIQDKYFVGDNSSESLRELFNKMVSNKEKSLVTLNIYEREVKIEDAYGDIVWFNFNQLCGRPLWSADYAEIARKFFTIFISEIPIFDLNNQNEMRRFTILIDELYECQNKLFCSLAAEPEFLYFQQEVPIDFQRTISRLIEMRLRN